MNNSVSPIEKLALQQKDETLIVALLDSFDSYRRSNTFYASIYEHFHHNAKLMERIFKQVTYNLEYSLLALAIIKNNDSENLRSLFLVDTSPFRRCLNLEATKALLAYCSQEIQDLYFTKVYPYKRNEELFNNKFLVGEAREIFDYLKAQGFCSVFHERYCTNKKPQP